MATAPTNGGKPAAEAKLTPLEKWQQELDKITEGISFCSVPLIITFAFLTLTAVSFSRTPFEGYDGYTTFGAITTLVMAAIFGAIFLYRAGLRQQLQLHILSRPTEPKEN